MGNVLRLAALALSLCPLGSATILFSNLTGALTMGFGPAGATDASIGTAVAAMELTFESGYEGEAFQTMTFGIWNGGLSSFSARPGFRFWLPDGASGAPGTLAAAFTLDAVEFSPGVHFVTREIDAYHVPVPAGGTYWVGVLFDGVGTSATPQQLNSLTIPVYGPPSVGSAPGTTFVVDRGSSMASNPSGDFTFNLSPQAFGMQFTVPEPGTATTLGVAAIGLICLARCRKRA